MFSYSPYWVLQGLIHHIFDSCSSFYGLIRVLLVRYSSSVPSQCLVLPSGTQFNFKSKLHHHLFAATAREIRVLTTALHMGNWLPRRVFTWLARADGEGAEVQEEGRRGGLEGV